MVTVTYSTASDESTKRVPLGVQQLASSSANILMDSPKPTNVTSDTDQGK